MSIMKLSLLSLLMLILPFLGMSYDPQEGSEELEVLLYIDHADIDQQNTEVSVYFEDGKQERMGIRLENNKHWYPFVLRNTEEEDHLIVRIGDQKKRIFFSEDERIIYMGVRRASLFPYDLSIWTNEAIEKRGTPMQVRIEGELPIATTEEISLHIPFLTWPGSADHFTTKVKQANDWKRHHFEFSFDLSAGTLVFLEINERYFPLLIEGKGRRHHFRHQKYFEVHFTKKGGKLIIEEDEDQNRGQHFLNAYFGKSGITHHEYESWVSSFREEAEPSFGEGSNFKQDGFFGESEATFGEEESASEEGAEVELEGASEEGTGVIAINEEGFAVRWASREIQQSTLLKMQQAILAYGEEINEEEGFEDILQVLNQLNENPWKFAFLQSFFDQRHRDQHDFWKIEEVYQSITIPGFFLFLFLFAFSLFRMSTRPNSFFSKHFLKIEIGLQAFIWLIIFKSFWYNNIDGILVSSSFFAVLALMTFIASANFNAYYLVPQLLMKKQYGKYLMFFAALGGITWFAIGFHAINPLGDYGFISASGDWDFIDWVDGNYHFEMPGGDADDFVPVHMVLAIASTIYGVGRHLLARRLPKLATKSQALNAELSTLKNQMSPHFFFNSLNTVYGFSLSEDSPKTADAITKLSDLMRFVIYEGNQEKVELEKELDYLTDYIELQRLRLDADKHELTFRIDGDPTGLKIAPLLLITSIENAFKHGISMSQHSFIHINLMILEKGLILSVENSNHTEKVLTGKVGVKEGGLGLANTRQRLNMLYAKKYDWHSEDKGDYYVSQLSIDLI